MNGSICGTTELTSMCLIEIELNANPSLLYHPLELLLDDATTYGSWMENVTNASLRCTCELFCS